MAAIENHNFTYQDAEKTLDGKDSKRMPRVATNLHRLNDDTIGLHYHDTRIITWQSDGKIILRDKISGAKQRSVTTKMRLNSYLPKPFKVYQHKFQWYVRDASGIDTPFTVGMVLDANTGLVVKEPAHFAAAV